MPFDPTEPPPGAALPSASFRNQNKPKPGREGLQILWPSRSVAIIGTFLLCCASGILSGCYRTPEERPQELFRRRYPDAARYELYETTVFQMKRNEEEKIDSAIYSYLVVRDAFSNDVRVVEFANTKLANLRKSRERESKWWAAFAAKLPLGSRLYLYKYVGDDRKEEGVLGLNKDGSTNSIDRLIMGK